ncbi:Terpene synthase metal-binding domain protein-like protein [Leptotrombidium deliense]|uniref:Terpene synthase n=1 Tax=Leptotrombidium deliense TaxID=299467 RepID=A0A443SBP4_9ACAR|nr:Terpene synthase metal-binding domain protein-like protein [Leptotrombidium deliense]
MYFPSKLHVDYEKIYEEVSKWTIKFNLYMGDREVYKRENVTKLACMCYPDGDYNRSVLVSKFMVHVFALDDAVECKVECQFFDSLVKHGSENKDVIALMDTCFEDKETPLVTSFADIWKQMKLLTNITYQKRFSENYIWYLKTNDWEHKNLEMKRIPPLAEFLEYRHFTGGVDPSLNLIEIARNIFIPDVVAANVTFQRLCYLSGNIVVLVNDIYSFEKEKLCGQLNNLVTVMKNEYNISDEEAIKKATDFINDEIKKFLVIERLMPIFEEEMNDCVQKYVDGCKTWITGNHDWGFESGRYITFGMHNV